MTAGTDFHVVTLGWDLPLIQGLWRRIEQQSGIRFSHIPHPRIPKVEAGDSRSVAGIHWLGLERQEKMLEPDIAFLESLESDGVPTLRNMILGDRVVSKLPYAEALGYATFLARRMSVLFQELEPSAIVGGFDAIHGSLGLAVARKMDIPWFAMHFSVIPPGLAGFCDAMSPSARVSLPGGQSDADMRAFAESTLTSFERRRLLAPAYIAPPPLSLAGKVRSIPGRVSAVGRTVKDGARRKYLRFTDETTRSSVTAAVRALRRSGAARKAISAVPALSNPPAALYVLFGLHNQPESSIDVWAPFFSNQMWVIETLSRALPPQVRLLVKIHKSDVSKYSREQLERMRAFPGVDLVRPFADSRAFIDGAKAVIAIQGTMGLEAALLGKPVIVLGDSPVKIFPSASRIGEITGLPELIRRKLAELPPSRDSIVAAYAAYLSPFRRAAHNDWREEKTDAEVANFAELFRLLDKHVSRGTGGPGSP